MNALRESSNGTVSETLGPDDCSEERSLFDVTTIHWDQSFQKQSDCSIYVRHSCFSLLLRAFTVYVRPLLEHNTVIWSPNLKGDIEANERVQSRFTKRIPGFGKLTYGERLNRLSIPTLELRRLRTDLIWCYKILFGCINTIASDSLVRRTTYITRGHPYKIYKQHSSERVANIWNSLPVDTDFSSLARFIHCINSLEFLDFCYIKY